jgi:hypothetical protein
MVGRFDQQFQSKRALPLGKSVVFGNCEFAVAPGRADCSVWVASPLQGEGEGEGFCKARTGGWKLKNPSPQSSLLAQGERRTNDIELTIIEHLPRTSRGITKIENKIVAAPTRVGFPIDFESIIRRKAHNAFIRPSCRENILVLHERK